MTTVLENPTGPHIVSSLELNSCRNKKVNLKWTDSFQLSVVYIYIIRYINIPHILKQIKQLQFKKIMKISYLHKHKYSSRSRERSTDNSKSCRSIFREKISRLQPRHS